MVKFRNIISNLYIFHNTHSKKRKHKMREFHRPFLQSLILIAVVTVFSMAYSRIFISNLYSHSVKNKEYTSQKIQLQTNTAD
jgi:hypothetical protein